MNIRSIILILLIGTPLSILAQDFSETVYTFGVANNEVFYDDEWKKNTEKYPRAEAHWTYSIQGAYNITEVEDQSSASMGSSSITKEYHGFIKRNATLTATLKVSLGGIKFQTEGISAKIESSPVINKNQQESVRDYRKQEEKHASATMSFKVKADDIVYDDSSLEKIKIYFGGGAEGSWKHSGPNIASNPGAISIVFVLTVEKGDEKTGHWRQVNKKYIRPEFKNYRYKGDITTETVMEYGADWVQYRMDCLEYPTDNSQYHRGKCQGEFLEAGIAYVEPMIYYEPQSPVQTTYCTKTTHSEKVCPQGLDFPVIQAYLTAPADNNKIIAYLENAEGKHLFEALHNHVKTEEPTDWGMVDVHVMNVADIKERANALMPGHEVGDTVLINYLISNGQRKHDRRIVYTYVWEEGKMPANKATFEEMEKKMKWFVPGNEDDSTNKWVWILIVTTGALGGGGVVGLILLKSKPKPKPLFNPDKKDKRYHEVMYNTTDDNAIRQMQSNEQMIHQVNANTEIELGDNFHNRVVTAVILDKSGDVAVEVLDNLGEKLISRTFKHGKTYLKGLAEDLVDGKEIKISIMKSTVKVFNDEAKEFLPKVLAKENDLGHKVYLKTTSDLFSNTFIKILEDGNDFDRNKLLSDTVLNGIGNFLDEFKFEDLTEIEGNKEIMKGLGEYLKRVFSYGTDSDVQDAISGARK